MSRPVALGSESHHSRGIMSLSKGNVGTHTTHPYPIHAAEDLGFGGGTVCCGRHLDIGGGLEDSGDEVRNNYSLRHVGIELFRLRWMWYYLT